MDNENNLEDSTDIAVIHEEIEAIESELVEVVKAKNLTSAMSRLSNSDDFDLVFNQHFLKHYRDTACSNIGNTNKDGRDNYAVGLAGRSMFEHFCNHLVEADKDMTEKIVELESEIKNLKSRL